MKTRRLIDYLVAALATPLCLTPLNPMSGDVFVGRRGMENMLVRLAMLATHA